MPYQHLIIKRLKKRGSIFKAILFEDSLFINYQMGRVGLTSISKHFRLNDRLEWHIHRFSDVYIHEKKKKNIFLKIIDKTLLKLALISRKKIKIICGFRDPVGRNISMFFQTFNGTFPDMDIKA